LEATDLPTTNTPAMTNNKAARDAGLTTLNHIEIVKLLGTGPETLTFIAAALGVSTAAMTQIADKLERLGIACRIRGSRGSRDRRAVWLKLTPAGLTLAAKLDQAEPAAF
jgi:DNA-binding MarR family transcriptional regulator